MKGAHVSGVLAEVTVRAKILEAEEAISLSHLRKSKKAAVAGLGQEVRKEDLQV